MMQKMKKLLTMTSLIAFILILTGCGKEVELTKYKLGETFKIAKEEVVLVDGNEFTITRLGNASCKRNAETCPFDGLKVEYEYKIKDKAYTKDDIDKTDYNIVTGETDYKNYVKVTITKKES